MLAMNDSHQDRGRTVTAWAVILAGIGLLVYGFLQSADVAFYAGLSLALAGALTAAIFRIIGSDASEG